MLLPRRPSRPVSRPSSRTAAAIPSTSSPQDTMDIVAAASSARSSRSGCSRSCCCGFLLLSPTFTHLARRLTSRPLTSSVMFLYSCTNLISACSLWSPGPPTPIVLLQEIPEYQYVHEKRCTPEDHFLTWVKIELSYLAPTVVFWVMTNLSKRIM
jgi:hypothetical protein